MVATCYATPHPQFYSDTVFRDIKAPDHGDLDFLDLVLPEAHKRGIKVYAWDYNIFRNDTPHVQEMQEEDVFGKKLSTCCAYNPIYQHFVVDLFRDHCTSYPIDGVMWARGAAGTVEQHHRREHMEPSGCLLLRVASQGGGRAGN